MTLHPIPLNFLIYEKNLILFFTSAGTNEHSVSPPDAEVDGCVGGEVHAVPVQDCVGTPPPSLALPLSSTFTKGLQRDVVYLG
jgi:hypothetical protein